MSTWHVAMVRIQNLELGVVAVDDDVLDDPVQREPLIDWWQEEFGRPVVLFGAETWRTYGQGDLGDLVSRLDPERFPWWSLSLAADEEDSLDLVA